ncbi:putative cystathionine gamma-synthase protein [Venturia nashicola]|nr:putative cystathionine gamma-synthase protein [Venturia nashicola]
MADNRDYAPDTLAVHADDAMNSYTDVAPALHVSTTYRYDNSRLVPISDEELDPLTALPVYSRLSAPNISRLELILSSLTNGQALTYSSGLSAFHAMLVFLRPKVIAISDGYHGCHGVIAILEKLYGLKKVNLWDEKEWDAVGFGEGDVVHVETPLNPTGEAINLEVFREKARKRGAYLTVDSTFGPPGLQDPFVQGADVIMHSGTKYFGGHSDMLCGVLVVRKEKKEWVRGLWNERMYLGSVMGNMESWLGVRSLRTLELRVARQSKNAESIVQWLDASLRGEGDDAAAVQKTVLKLQHASLQKDDMEWIKKQMPGGFGPVFVIWMKSMRLARALPGKLKLFHHATSLGGVESLIEWRKMSDSGVDARVLRVSIGVEHWEDLRADFLEGFKALALSDEVNGA